MDIPSVDLVIKSEPVIAKPRKLRAVWTRDVGDYAELGKISIDVQKKCPKYSQYIVTQIIVQLYWDGKIKI